MNNPDPSLEARVMAAVDAGLDPDDVRDLLEHELRDEPGLSAFLLMHVAFNEPASVADHIRSTQEVLRQRLLAQSATTGRRKRLHFGWFLNHPFVSTLAILIPVGMGEGVRQHVTYRESPSSITIQGDYSEAVLRNRDGDALYTWGDGITPYSIRGTSDDTVQIFRTAAGRRVAALCFSHSSPDHPRQLAAFDVDSQPGTPLWTRRIEDKHVPPDLLAREPQAWKMFSPRFYSVADVFPELEGLEVIAVFQHFERSQCAIHIYDLDGDLLWQAWHNGNLTSVYWLSDPGELICAGLNGEVDALDRGLASSQKFHAPVVLAVTPEHGQIEAKWIDTVDHDGGARPQWYQAVLVQQDESTWSIGPISRVRVDGPSPAHDPTSTFTLAVLVALPNGQLSSVNLTVGPDGHETCPRVVHDAYRRAVATTDLARPDQIHLCDLPQITDVTRARWLPGQQQPADPQPHVPRSFVP